MKRDSVVVNGITLTRAQVQQAMKDLDTPDLSIFKGGNILHLTDGRHMLVPNNGTQKALWTDASTLGFNPADTVCLINMEDGSWVYQSPAYWCDLIATMRRVV